MTSKIKVDNINKVSDDSTIIKKCGTTTTIGSGASNPIVVDGSAVTIGRCGGTVALASGASQTGFGRTGTVDWQTTIKTGDFTAVSGEGYFVNTTSGEIDVTLPAGSAGSIVAVADYANTADTNSIILKQNGSDKIEGSTDDLTLNVEGSAVTLVFADSTKGWIVTDTGNSTELFSSNFVIATGGTITTSGNFKIHTFTGPGTFSVSDAGNPCGSNTVSYMVAAGGGSGGCKYSPPGTQNATGGGGGAGGYRESKAATDSYTASPLNATSGPTYNIPVTAQSYPITVGGGGAETPGGPSGVVGNDGNPSSFSTITSTAGGGGGSDTQGGRTGGSGGGRGGESNPGPGAAGNTPPVSPPQGNNGGAGGAGGPGYGSGGGGGAACAGEAGGTGGSGNGGAGVTTHITGSPVAYAGGGGAGGYGSACYEGSGGAGGGGTGSSPSINGAAGTANTGGGGGGGGTGTPTCNGKGKAGGSGVVIIRYKFQ